MQPDPISREQAESLAGEIIALDGVAGLDGGRFGEVALLYPGGRIRGLHIVSPRTDPEHQRLEVSVVADGQALPNLDNLAEDVRRIAANYIDLPVDVTISDVA